MSDDGRAVFHALRIENDVEIPMRDGAALSANVFRPDAEGTFPAIVTLGPYPKDIHFKDWDRAGFYPKIAEHGPLMHWETVNPEWWVPQGYTVVRIDARDTGKSKGGRSSVLSMREAQDFHDAIEWIAAQPHCNGKVAVMGISYFAMNAWRVASLKPPHLAAIVPWEGALDLYRDAGRHGGIASNTFARAWSSNVEKHGAAPAEGAAAAGQLLDERQRRNHPDVGQIEVPLFSAANWGGAGLHLRGNIEGFLHAGSAYRQLRIHVGDHCSPFYSAEGRSEQKRFLDRWLKGIDTGIEQEPPIKLAVRLGGAHYRWRYEHEWPLARTRWTPYFLDARDGSLGPAAVFEPAYAEYGAGGSDAANRVRFALPRTTEEVELTGPIKLKLWVSCEAGDADLMVSLRHLDERGEEIEYPAAVPPDIGAAYGWLRVSHRKLDRARSLPYRPYLAHDELQPTRPFEVVPVEVEIWPSCIVLAHGHSLELVIAAEDDPRLRPFTHTDEHDRVRKGRVRVHTGGDYDSHLLLPRIPPRG